MPEPYANYEDLITRLDEGAEGLDKASIASLVDYPPKYLSDPQIDWLKSLEARYL